MRKKIISAVLIVLGLIIACMGLFPFLWMAISGFKSKTEVLATPFRFFPSEWKFENYKLLFTYQNLDYSNPDYFLFPQGSSFVGALGLTLTVALTSLVLSLFINSSAAYVFARLEFPFKKVLWSIYAVTMFVPNIAILIPCFQVVSTLHLTNNVVALILPGVVYVWSIFFYRQFYLGMPTSLEDAARIDGCGRFKIREYFPAHVCHSLCHYGNQCLSGLLELLSLARDGGQRSCSVSNQSAGGVSQTRPLYSLASFDGGEYGGVYSPRHSAVDFAALYHAGNQNYRCKVNL